MPTRRIILLLWIFIKGCAFCNCPISNAGAKSASIHVTGSYTDIRFGTTLPVFNHIGVKDDIGSFISGKTVDDIGQLATGSLYVRVSGSGTGRVAQVCIYGYFGISGYKSIENRFLFLYVVRFFAIDT